MESEEKASWDLASKGKFFYFCKKKKQPTFFRKRVAKKGDRWQSYGDR
jgi:hypothetical protein